MNNKVFKLKICRYIVPWFAGHETSYLSPGYSSLRVMSGFLLFISWRFVTNRKTYKSINFYYVNMFLGDPTGSLDDFYFYNSQNLRTKNKVYKLFSAIYINLSPRYLLRNMPGFLSLILGGFLI